MNLKFKQQDIMKNINIGEYWHVQYGLQEKTNIVVKVLGLSENGKAYKCEHKGDHHCRWYMFYNKI